MISDIELLRTRLASRRRIAVREPQSRNAAVLVPLVGNGANLRLICFERTHEVMEHKGEICFPGGSIELQDRDPVDAALREAHEELGLARDLVDILGVLDDVQTFVSGYIVTPVVGHLRDLPPLVPDPLEVARPVIVTLDALRAPGAERVESQEWRGTVREIYSFPADGGRIWGATARIIHNLLSVWAQETVTS